MGNSLEKLPLTPIMAGNRAFEEFYGLSKNQISGKTVYDVAPKELPDIYHHKDTELFRNPGSQVYESQVRPLDGSTREVVFHKATYTDASGAVGGLAGVVLDVTELKAANQVQQMQHDLIGRILETSPAPIVALDLQGRITFANALAVELLGWRKDEIIGRTHNDPAWTPTDFDGRPIPETELPLQRVIATGKPVYQMPLAIKRSDGRRAYYLVNGAPLLDRQGNLEGALFSGEDITENRAAEQALRQSEELYRSLFDNMLNGLAYCKVIFDQGQPQDFIYLSVNHSFETLTGLKNVVGKKVSEVIPGIRQSDPELFEIYDRVALTGKPERVETYVEALKSWFSVSVHSPEKEYFVAIFDVITERKRTEAALSMAKARLQKVETRLELSAGPIYLDGMPGLLTQAFLNLLLNALNAMPNGEILSVHLKPVDQEAIITISDTGRGIPASDLPHIFDPFFTSAAGGEGTGLGLSICHSFIKQHRGSIGVESVSGKGTSFTVRLPRLP